MPTQTQLALTRFTEQIQPQEQWVRAVIGHPDGRTVAVPGSSGRIYVRLVDASLRLVAARAPTRAGVTAWGQRVWVRRGRSSYEVMLPDVPRYPGSMDTPYAYCQVEFSLPGTAIVDTISPVYTCSVPTGVEIRGFDIYAETPPVSLPGPSGAIPRALIVDIEHRAREGEWESIFPDLSLAPFLFPDKQSYKPFWDDVGLPHPSNPIHLDHVYDGEVSTTTSLDGSISDSGQDFRDWGLQASPPRKDVGPARFMVIARQTDGSYGWGYLWYCNVAQTCSLSEAGVAGPGNWYGTGGTGYLKFKYKVVASDYWFSTKKIELGEQARVRILAVGYPVPGADLVVTLFVRQVAKSVSMARVQVEQ